MENKLYLIHEEDYVKHIDEGMVLYTVLKEITRHVAKLPSNRGNKSLTDLAAKADRLAEKIYRTWGIPASYAYTFNRANLAFLMENELIVPEDAGYFACDEDCCGNCECCCSSENNGEDDNYDEMMAALTSAICDIFGDTASVRIIVE